MHRIRIKIKQTPKTSFRSWLNNPRVPREASGTSGMTAAHERLRKLQHRRWNGFANLYTTATTAL